MLAAFGPTYAAEIALVDSPHCHLRVRGPIVKGDFEKLKEAIAAADAKHGSNETSICLDSPGGDFPEGLRIIEHLDSTASAGTVVENGAECAAVCAYIFMAGRFIVFHAITYPLRKLHVGGKLNFFIPTRATGASALDAKSARDAYRDGVKSVALLVKRNATYSRQYHDAILPYPQTLLRAALASEPDAPLPVDTIEKTAMWGITIVGYRKPEEIALRHLHQACLTGAEWGIKLRNRPVGKGKGAEAAFKDAPIALAPGQLHRASFAGFGTQAQDVCVADVYRSPKSGLHINLDFGLSARAKSISAPDDFKKLTDDPHGDFASRGLSEGVPLSYIFAPETRLADIVAR